MEGPSCQVPGVVFPVPEHQGNRAVDREVPNEVVCRGVVQGENWSKEGTAWLVVSAWGVVVELIHVTMSM